MAPNSTPSAPFAVASVAAGGWRWLWALGGALGLWAFFAVLSRVPGGVGGGDVMLAPMIGLLLGWLSPVHVLVGLFATFLVGGAQAALLLLTGRVGPKDAVAFGPAMCVGAWIAIGSTSQIVTFVFSV